MSKEELQQQREVLALVSWLQTFEQFPFSLIDGFDGENITERFSIVLESLENAKISRAVAKVAEEVCDIKSILIDENESSEEMWNCLLRVTAAKSRFEIYTTPSNAKYTSEIPHVVLSNLIDFAVTSPDLDERRKYIERIMQLSKTVQKILMSLIERMKKTLPRKPKSSGSSLSKAFRRSPKVLCKKTKEATEFTDTPIEPVEDANSTSENSNSNDNQDGNDSHVSSEDIDRSAAMRESPQRSEGFSTPRSNHSGDGIPQTEPRPPNKGLGLIPAPTSEQKRPSFRFPSRERRRSSDELHAPKPRQPEGFYMTQNDKRRCTTIKGFSSPPRDRRRRSLGFGSSSKRQSHSASFMPFRERQVQVQRASSISIFDRTDSGSQSSRTKGVLPPPPPPPPKLSSEQKMPSAPIPTDEIEVDNNLIQPMTDQTFSHMTESSTETNSGVAPNHGLPDGKTLANAGLHSVLSNNYHGNGYSTPPRRTGRDESMSASSNKTPEMSLALYERDVDVKMMLSPDGSMLQSPMQVDDFVKNLKAKNKSLESILQSYQKRERELMQKMESTESKLRKEMMKLENRALGREDELRHNYEAEMSRLKKELRAEKEQNKESKRAKEELANANDELDLMQHTHEKLLEATEKIRKYKERLDSMNDYREALQREQDAHSKSVDECVRLQNELNVLQPLKRQLEDYKNKAIETEVELAEVKDALLRLERERAELNGAREDVIKEAQAQRAQAEELRQFIHLEEKQEAGPGIGDGISELNPELQEELIKLRNENERLRAFAEERTDDSVQRLHESLEDSNLRQERFKGEYLNCKNKLESTESYLNEARQKLEELESDIEQKDQMLAELEGRLSVLGEHLSAALEDNEGLHEDLETTKESNQALEADLAEWKQMAHKLETELQNRSTELESTTSKLQETEEIKSQLEIGLSESKNLAEKLEAELQFKTSELDETKQTLDTTKTEKTQLEEELSDWKQMSGKLEEELRRKNQELNENRLKLSSVENERTELESDVMEWKEMTDKLEAELKSRTFNLGETRKQVYQMEEMLKGYRDQQEDHLTQISNLASELKAQNEDLEETKKQLAETEETLQDAGERQENLLHRIDVYEKKLIEAEEDNEAKTKEIEDTQKTLKETETLLQEAKNRETNLNEECRELKDVSEQLVKQLKEEKKLKKALNEESHRTLEATREVLNSKAKKELEELQANMNQLLNDERKAYRLKAEKASIEYKKLDEKHKKKLAEVRQEAAATLTATEEDSQRRMQQLEEKMKAEIESIKKQEKLKKDQYIEQTEAHVKELRANCTLELQKVESEKKNLAQKLREKEEELEHQVSKAASFKDKLIYATHQINEFERNEDELRDDIGSLEHAKNKLEEENERYRRQLGGRYGSDGTLQSQVETLNKELMEAHNENRDLKQKLAAKSVSADMSLPFTNDHGYQHGGYSRDGVNTSALSQMRNGYEEQIASLNEEKRELVMKNSAANVDVQKAYQVAEKREKEISELKKQLTDLQLQLKRAELVNTADENIDTSFYDQPRESATESSFHSQPRDLTFSSYDAKSTTELNQTHSNNRSYTTENESHESPLRDGGLSINTSPKKSSSGKQKVLTPSTKYKTVNNSFSERSSSDNTHQSPTKANPYQLHMTGIGQKSPEMRNSVDEAVAPNFGEGNPTEDAQSECAQS